MTASPDAPAGGAFRSRPLLGALRVFLVLSWIGTCLPFQAAARAFNLKARRTIPVFFHRVLTRFILGMRIEVVGAPVTARPAFFVCNHMSYADIPVIGSVIPASFVARADSARWPLLGLLAKLQDSVFVERGRRAQSRAQNQKLSSFLESGGGLVLFPEGTSSDGRGVLPFKSTLLQAAFDAPPDLAIQPVTLACLNDDGLGRLYPWHGEMNFPGHAWPFLQVPRFVLRLTFHPPVAAAQFAGRKNLAERLHATLLSAPCGVAKG